MRSGENLFSRLQIGLAGLVIFAFLVVGVFGVWMAPHDPVRQDLAQVLQPPAWHAEGSMVHPLGTAMLGQDVLSGIMAGARISLLVSLCAVGLSGVFGVVLGLVAGLVVGGAVGATVTGTVVATGFVVAVTAVVVGNVDDPGFTEVVLPAPSVDDDPATVVPTAPGAVVDAPPVSTTVEPEASVGATDEFEGALPPPSVAPGAVDVTPEPFSRSAPFPSSLPPHEATATTAATTTTHRAMKEEDVLMELLQIL